MEGTNMYCGRINRTGFIIFLIFVLPLLSFADIRNYIVFIKPVFSEITKTHFNQLADYFDKHNRNELAHTYRNFIEHGHVSGFIVSDRSGEIFIITSSFLLTYAEQVEVMKYDGDSKSYHNCPILFIDETHNLAVLQFPGKEKDCADGLKICTHLRIKTQAVWSAGFSGITTAPIWKMTKGKLIDQYVRIQQLIDPKASYIMIHTSMVDPGNSGGPLLIKDWSRLDYSVIGVNIWMPYNQCFLTIPAENIKTVLAKAKQAENMKLDYKARKQSLEIVCNMFVAELTSGYPDITKVGSYISYELTSTTGFSDFNSILAVCEKYKAEKWMDYFLHYSPLKAMRSAVFMLIWHNIHTARKETEIIFKSIIYTHEKEFIEKDSIRTLFEINGREKEITWIFENGTWKIKKI
jgi:hypothetical protein